MRVSRSSPAFKRLVTITFLAIVAVAIPSVAVLSGESQATAARQPVAVGNSGSRAIRLGFAPQAGSISGFVFFDRNGNALRDAGEPGLEGVTLNVVDIPANGQMYSASTITAADGSFQFSALMATTYRVTATDLPGYVSITPNALEVSVGNSPVSGQNFADAVPLTIVGTAFNDLDGDGVQKPSELPFVGWLASVVADLNANGAIDADEPVLGTDTTDAMGVYIIEGIRPGPRIVKVQEIGGAGRKRENALFLNSDEVFGSRTEKDFPIVPAGDEAHGASGKASPAVTADRYAPDQLMVRFLPRTSGERIGAILASNGLTVVRHIPGIDVYVVDAGQNGALAAVGALRGVPGVEYAELDYVVQGELAPSDPNYQDPVNVYAPRKVNAEAGWDIETGKPGVIVAVIDSGVSPSHPELSGKLLACAAVCDFINNDTLPVDDHGHGTHVAGIIAAEMNNGIGSTGIAPGVRIMPVKVLNSSNSGTWSGIAAGIDYAVANGADIINLSLGGTTTSQTLLLAIQNAAANNVFIAAAAGNNGSTTPFFPAYYEQTLAVVNTNNYDQRYSSSNYGSWVDISAPGFAVYSTHWSATNGNTSTYMTGTSQAAPHVSALAALLLSHRPDLRPVDLRTLIQQYAFDLGTAGRDDQFGWGRIDVGNTLAASTNWQPITPTPTVTPVPTLTFTPSPTFTPTPTNTLTPSRTPTQTLTPVFTYTPSSTPTSTSTPTPSSTPTASSTPTDTPTRTPTIPPPYLQRVNVGSVSYADTQGRVWAADKKFSAGSWGYMTGSAKSSTIAVTGTDDDFLYQKYREIAGEYRFTVPSGMYDVTLKFAEFAYFDDVSRKMTISMEGVVRDTIAIFTQAGKYTALDKTYTVTVSDGLLNILFAKAAGAGRNPAISAIEVKTAGPTPTPTPTNTPCLTCPTETPTPTATPTLTPPPYVQRVNSGSTTYTDTAGHVWAADKLFVAGSWGYTLGSGRSSSAAVANTLDDFLYQMYREKPGEYKFTVPNGTYAITLKFAEFGVTNATDRLMSVTIEGVAVDTFSVWNLVGSAVALDRTYEATVADGVLNILFARAGSARKDPAVSAVEVRTK